MPEHDSRLLGLRDRLFSRGQPSLAPGRDSSGESAVLVERIRPFAQVMFLVMTADGDIADEERQAARGALRTLTGGQVSSRTIERMVAEFEAAALSEGRESCLEQVAAHLSANREDSELALALAAAVAIADDTLQSGERDVLSELAMLLGVPKQRRDELVGELL